MPVILPPNPRGLGCLAAVVLASLACASKPGAGGPGVYRGVVVTGSETGTLEVVVGEAGGSPFPASATLSFANRTAVLSGTLDSSQTKLSLSSSEGYQLTGQSRPKYVAGSYAGPAGANDNGSFGLSLVPADGTPIRLVCGKFVMTTTISATTTGTTTTIATNPTILPFAVTALAPGPALCVGPNFTWSGSLGVDGNLYCSSYGGEVGGNVDNMNTDASYPWTTTTNSGTWTVAPCGSLPADGGIGDDAGADGAAPDVVNDAAGAREDAPALPADAPADLTPDAD
jgi:hypothetical protein